jgi:hypothetical protein
MGNNESSPLHDYYSSILYGTKVREAQNDSLNSQRTGQNGIIFKETMKAILILFKYLLYRQSLNPLMLKFLYGRHPSVN